VARVKRLFAWQVLLACAAILTPATSADSESGLALTPASGPIPLTYFSMNILFHPLNKVPWPSVPLGGWRTSHVNWADLQLSKDHWYFDLLDRYVQWSLEHHTEILMPLTYTPRWASSTPDAPTDVEAGNPPGLSGAPRDMEDWRIFVKTIATRYKGRIHYWEIWNEPNRGKSWTGSVDTLVEMTNEAVKILKETDPRCIVVSPAPTGTNGLQFFKDFLQTGGARNVDVVGYHFYVGRDDGPEAMVALIQQVRSAARKYGADSKPLWNTETGWIAPSSLSPEVSAAYVSRAFILNWAAGVTRFYWYAWEIQGTQIRLTERDNLTLTEAGRALATTETWMEGATMTRCLAAEDETWVCDLNSHGRTEHIVWNAKRNTQFAIPEAWHAKVSSPLSGNSEGIDGHSIVAGIQPELIQ
jgi:hypothetical protein